MRIVVVGAGRIGAMHARALAGIPAVTDLVVADTDRGRAEGLAAELACRAAEVDSLWEDGLDGAVIASASPTHAALVEAALDAGVPVLCEKPLTTTLEQSLRIGERSAATGVPVQVGFQRRFDASFRRLREELGRGDYGAPWVLRLRHSDTGLPPPGYLAAAGSLFLDMCIHEFDAVRWIAGCEVEAVSSAGLCLTGDPEVTAQGDVDAAVSLLRLENGSLAVVEAFRQSPHGYLAEAEVTAAGVNGGTSPRPRRAASWMERFAPAFAAQLEGFVATVRDGTVAGATARDATAGMRVALAAERAFREDRTVSVGEVE